MKRRVISVIQSRMEDVAVGDVVNRNPDAQKGWFRVAGISTLFSGELQLSDETELVTIAATAMDIVGVQVFEEVEIDSAGLLVPLASPPVMVATAAPSSGAVPNAPASAAADPSAHSIGAQIMRDVDQLSTVANLLDSLPVESAPEIEVRTEPLPGATPSTVPPPAPAPERSTPAATPEPVMPEGAVPVFGDTLPDKPSYKNPVVVAQGDKPLPKRRQAA